VKKVVGSTTTIYVGNYYEKTGSTIRKYYYFAGQRVAMRDGSTVYYLVTDHLSSTSKTLTSSGGVFGELRYKPYGEIRYTYGTTPTNYRFTGQLQEASINLYIMGARWYDSSLARWLSPDTLVPNPATPQSLNRYTYTAGNPLKFIDLTGHKEEGECGFWGEACHDDPLPSPPTVPDPALPTAEESDAQEIDRMLQEIAANGGAEAAAYVREHGWKIRYGKPLQAGGFTYPWHLITIRRYAYKTSLGILVHEVGHAWLYQGALAASLEQEYEVEAFAKPIQLKLAVIGEDEYKRFAEISREEFYNGARGADLWRCALLPEEQPHGLAGFLYAVDQGLFY
jgi:RHS repeat-associated protein